jgi:hypothetical protein
MPTRIEITCFTDLRDSTRITEELGHEAFMPRLEEHLRVGRELAERNGGVYVKNIGDAHMVRFEELEAALSFGSQLQAYYKSQPCMSESGLQLRVAFFQGAVQPSGNDVFGSGVNQAARVQGLTAPGAISVNAALYQTARTAFGAPEAERMFSSIGEHELKGISEPPRQELFVLNWEYFLGHRPNCGLAQLVFQHFKRADVDLSNINIADMTSPRAVLWPVVPRDLPTAIHRGQVEVIRLLALLGWRIKFVIADCGDERLYDRPYIERFARRMGTYLARRGLSNIDTSYLSDMFSPTYGHYDALQRLFRQVASFMSVQDLLALNNKEYAEEVKSEHLVRSTLTYLRAPLTIAAVLHLAIQEGGKCIAVSGRDEYLQWTHAYTIPGASDNIGALMIPIVKMSPNYQLQQKERWPIWDSEARLVEMLQSVENNVGWWSFRLHAFLPAFPANRVKIGDREVNPDEWTTQFSLPEHVIAEDLGKNVWPLLDPTL